jgi:ArsR family transcriptional regulator
MNAETIFDIQASLCSAMSHPLRQQIVHILREGSKTVREICELTGQPQATVSRNLTVLRNAKILSAERDSQHVSYQIANKKMVEICDLMHAVLLEQIQQQSDLISKLE